MCGTYNSLGKAACASKQIPESTLQQVTADVLGQNDFTHEWLCHRIQHIRVCNDNTLIFYFKDGSEITRIWKDRLRSQSWTDEMKEAARLLQFEHAAFLRDEIEKLQRGEDPTADTSTRRAAEKQRKTGKGRRSYKK